MTAHDADGSPLTYALDYPSDEIASLFHISPLDGKLYVRNPLDREQFDHYTFHITASDSFHKSSRVKIIVKVFDVNDEIPRFSFPNEHNDTLIIDRTYWHIDDYICQIDIQDHDQIPNHTLQLIESFDQLKNFDYITEQKPASFEFDSSKFYLDDQAKLYFNRTNRTALTEGVYYLAFKVSDQSTTVRSIVRFSPVDIRWAELLRRETLEAHRREQLRTYSSDRQTVRLSRLAFEQSPVVSAVSLD